MQATPRLNAAGESLLSVETTAVNPMAHGLPMLGAAGWASAIPGGWRGPGTEEPASSLKGAQSLAREAVLAQGAGLAHGVGLAHDAGNLLGAIRLYCDLLALPGVLRAEHRHYAEELRQLSARGGSLLNQLLRSAAFPEADRTASRASQPETVRLVEVVLACRGLLDTMIGQGCLLMTMDAAAAETRVAVPRETVERILVNLTKNAVEASEGQGTGAITVRVRVPEGASPGVTLRVEDTGRGMSEAALRTIVAENPARLAEDRPARLADDLPARLADDRLAVAGTVRPGRGIGLRVVRELVADTGGTMRIESRLGRGTAVEIRWPAVGDAARRDRSQPAKSRQKPW